VGWEACEVRESDSEVGIVSMTFCSIRRRARKMRTSWWIEEEMGKGRKEGRGRREERDETDLSFVRSFLYPYTSIVLVVEHGDAALLCLLPLLVLMFPLALWRSISVVVMFLVSRLLG